MERKLERNMLPNRQIQKASHSKLLCSPIVYSMETKESSHWGAGDANPRHRNQEYDAGGVPHNFIQHANENKQK